MKLTPIAVLNKIGFTNAEQKALYAASLLYAGLRQSPAVIIRKAVAGKAAVVGVPAFAGRAASAAIAANASNPAIAANALFPGSPAFAAGAAVPAFPAKPAIPEVMAQPAVAAVAALSSPAINPLPGWGEAVMITKTETAIGVVAYLPVSTSPMLLGAPTDTISSILEITPAALQATNWIGELASATPTTDTTNVAVTMEQYLYEQALALGAGAIVENMMFTLTTGVKVPCKKITLNLSATGYIPMSDDLQLAKIGSGGDSQLMM
jgi:hypothetical protein